jgi:hypothetical protein
MTVALISIMRDDSTAEYVERVLLGHLIVREFDASVCSEDDFAPSAEAGSDDRLGVDGAQGLAIEHVEKLD